MTNDIRPSLVFWPGSRADLGFEDLLAAAASGGHDAIAISPLTIDRLFGAVWTASDIVDETAAAGNNRFIHVLSIDGAVTSATAAGDTVTVHLAGGQTATVAFNHVAIGATLTYGGANVTRAAGVDTLAP